MINPSGNDVIESMSEEETSNYQHKIKWDRHDTGIYEAENTLDKPLPVRFLFQMYIFKFI
jgi:hypothetical protein